MYRDSQLGLCLDLTGPEGNVFALLGIGNDLAKQLGQEEEWKQTVEAVKLMGGGYITTVNCFRDFFPVITLIGYEEVTSVHETLEET